MAVHTNGAQVSASEPTMPETEPMPIAIIGMGCRLPGDSTSPGKLWNLLSEGRSAWSPINTSRFHGEAWYHPNKGHIGTSYVKGAHYLTEDVALFDASFFNFSADIASTMDPEIRIQLETVYEALENAGIPVESVIGSDTSVFAGTSFRDNHDNHMRDPACMDDGFFVTGNGATMIANRVSHFYDLRGASIMVDTGCSTSLTLLHLACQNLRAGESKMSIVGGSGVLMNPEMFIAGTKLGIFSKEGKSFAFDSRADGYGRGDGIATIVLKPLADAVRDGDAIRAVIRNTAANQDGKTTTITSPSPEAQRSLMRACYASAGLNPADTSYIEAHGTGTQAGDVIEANAVGDVFGENRDASNPLIIGSIKTNLGHTEASSGLAGILKVVMALEKGAIPPNVNYESPNPKIALDQLKLKVPTSLLPWPSQSLRRASVNNFGYGGANAHVIIEHPDYLLKRDFNRASTNGVVSEKAGRSRVFVWSGKDKHVADALRGRLHDYLSAQSQDDAEDVLDRLAYTLGSRRSRFPWTAACAASSLEDLIRAVDEESTLAPQRSSKVPRLGFVFTGQGAQWYAMGRELLEAYPVFKDTLLRAQKCIYELGCSWSLIEELTRDEATTHVNEVAYSLPLSVAIQLALIDLLRSWGINPSGVTGHSSGEVSAAYAAGAIGLKSALAIVYCRGDLTDRINKMMARPGGMIAVGLGRDEVNEKISHIQSGELVAACINSPSSVTVSGDVRAILDFEARMADEKVFARRLKVNAAYHSPLMQPIAEPYTELLTRWVKPEKANKDVIYSSPTTGRRIYKANDIGKPDHWVRNMIQPVEFVDCLRNLCVDEEKTQCIDMLIEVGPHGALGGPIRQTLMLPELKALGISYSSCLTRRESAVRTMQALACNLLQQGYPVDLAAVNFPLTHGHGLQILTDLPPYPWNHQTRYWKEPRLSKANRERKTPPHDLLGRPTADFPPLTPTWRHIIRPRDLPWVRDHIIQGSIVYPGAGYIAMAIEATKQMSQHPTYITGYKLEAIDIMQALVLEDTIEGIDVRVSLRPCADRILQSQGWNDFHIQSMHPTGKWILHCEGRIATTTRESKTFVSHDDTTYRDVDAGSKDKSQWCAKNSEDIYEALGGIGLTYGPMFQNQVSALKGEGCSSATIKVSDTASVMPFNYQQSHVIHPTTLDTMFQAVFHNLPSAAEKKQDAMVPKTIRSLYISADISSDPGHLFEMSSQLNFSRSSGFESSASIGDIGGEGSPLLTMYGLYCQSVGGGAASTESDEDKLCFSTSWRPDLDMIKVPGLVSSNATDKIREVMELLRHKSPLANVLEIGADNGDCTRIVVDALAKRPNGLCCGRYDVTDTSTDKLDATRSTIENADHIGFRAYDIDADPISQELTQGTYDLVLASSAIYSALDFNQSMSYVRSLLKTGGKLLIHGSAVCFEWRKTLESAGFATISGDTDSDIILATAVKVLQESEKKLGPAIVLVYASSEPPTDWLKQVVVAISQKVVPQSISIQALSGMGKVSSDTFVVFLEELIEPFLDQPTDLQFQQLQVLLSRFESLLWVSKGAQIDSPNPLTSLHHGLLRTLRCENTTRKYVSLDLDPAAPTWDASSALQIASILHATIENFSRDSASPELEYAVRSGVFRIPRIYQDSKQNNSVATSVSRQTPEVHPFFQEGRDLKLASTAPGMVQNLTWVEDPELNGPLDDDCVEIKPYAIGLNFRDLMVALDQLHMQRMGFECAGIVTAVGPEAAASGFAVGDRVCTLTLGCFATKVRVRHVAVVHLPDFIDFGAGASLLMVHTTVYHSLYEVAHLKPKETILIHSGSGGVGQSAIMMAQNIGAEVFVTVGSPKKREFLTETYGISDDHIFSSHDASFADEIMARTGGKGVDVVLNSLAGPLLRATWDCIARFGRFIEIGKRDIEQANIISMAPFARCVSFASVDLMSMFDHRPEQFFELIQIVGRLVADKKIGAVTPINAYSITELEQAFRMMQEGRHMGKIVLEPREGALVKVLPSSKPIELSSKGSYLIVGGLGGIGKSMAQLFVERGAKQLILMSRSAASPSVENEEFIEKLRAQGANIALKSCDVANKAHLAEVLTECAVSLPPIKGVVQSAMVLRDSIFEKMTYNDYTTVIQGKVHGTWNLHELVPNANLDFFIMLSSISGVGGNTGQANYAAGGTFQDAVAHYRSALGLPAVSLDLGMVKSVGVLSKSKNSAVANHLVKAGLRPLEEAEVLRLVESAIRSPRRSPQSSQVITGIPPDFVRSSSASFWNRDSRFVPLERVDAGASTAANGGGAVVGTIAHTKALVSACKTLAEARKTITDVFVAKLATEFGRPEADIDPSLALTEIGLDSLIAVELRNWIVASLDAECSIFDVT
ncbi:putative polyketide synthase [Thelonectria olida]|uniref:Polyketide synthase n=1 Tax=Thelonectria olida TaxID=1576542 RepID=A0A9P8VQW4_9HYPO|nr:putative polyketide synthase [Thelonectria olida]